MRKNLILVTLLGGLLNAGGNEFLAKTTPIAVVDKAHKYYVGLGLSAGEVSSYYYGKDNIAALKLKAGYNISKYLAVELRIYRALKDGKQLGLDYSYGLYLKPQYPINNKLSVYALIGYAKTKISFDNEYEFNGIKNNYTTQKDISYGIGVDYKIAKHWSISADVTKLINKTTTKKEGKYASKVNTVSAGIVYGF